MPTTSCQYCDGAPTPPEQFYETKLFRVLVSRNAIAAGQVIIVPKHHDPHFYSFNDEQMEEFGYLIKKVSFWAMRYTRTHGFTILMNDGTVEVSQDSHLMIHIVPRQFADAKFTQIVQQISLVTGQLTDEQIAKAVGDMKGLMQLPQDNV
ncbi:MAG: HIT domain-containing protein [Candidatus Kerfeldbacteria bacterium]